MRRVFALIGVMGIALALVPESRAQGAIAPGSPAVPDRKVSPEETYADVQKRIAKAPTERDGLAILLELADLQRRRGDYAAGLDSARAGLAQASRIRDERLQADFLYRIGRLYWNLADYPHSIESHLEELRLADKLADEHIQARAQTALGNTYYRFGRLSDALAHFNLALELSMRSGNRTQQASVLNGLGDTYMDLRDYDRASRMHGQALALRQALGDAEGIADSLTNLGLVAAAQGDPDTALRNLRAALEVYERSGLRRYIANTHRRMATILRQMGRTDEALLQLGEARRVGEPLDSADVMAAIYSEYAGVYERRGDYASALDYERKRAAATERVRGEADRQAVAELEARFQADQRELQITLLHRADELKVAEIRRRRFQNLALAAGLVLALISTGAVIVIQRIRLRAERQLLGATEDARRRAEAADRLKTKLFQMASHDLKVPLRALHATAERFAEASQGNAEVRRLAENMRADTFRMRTLVEDFLTAEAIEHKSLQLKREPLDLASVTATAVNSLALLAAAKQQKLALSPFEVPSLRVWADEPKLRQVFDNLLSNALKFSPFGGAITVALGKVDAWAFAEIQDSGPGLSPTDFAGLFQPHRPLSALPTAGEHSSGLGLFIARELLTLQGGRLEVESQPGAGAAFRILLPLVAEGATG